MYPSPARGLVAVALCDLVEVGAGSDGGALVAGDGHAVRAAEGDDLLAARLLAGAGLALAVGVGVPFQVVQRFCQMGLVSALTGFAGCGVVVGQLVVPAGLGQVGVLVLRLFAELFREREGGIEDLQQRLAVELLSGGVRAWLCRQ